MIVDVNIFSPKNDKVTVIFSKGNFKFEREVNVVLKSDGTYDAEAMNTRINEVALGILSKIQVGVIKTEEQFEIDEPVQINDVNLTTNIDLPPSTLNTEETSADTIVETDSTITDETSSDQITDTSPTTVTSSKRKKKTI